MCRHSYVIVIGGGAALDLVGFAASTAHRGVRLVRFPTTTLSQGDGGVGVKNGVNYFGKKNWIGTFSVPEAVVNDFNFLLGLPHSQKRAGYVEAIKVALIRDRSFFEFIEENNDIGKESFVSNESSYAFNDKNNLLFLFSSISFKKKYIKSITTNKKNTFEDARSKHLIRKDIEI